VTGVSRNDGKEPLSAGSLGARSATAKPNTIIFLHFLQEERVDVREKAGRAAAASAEVRAAALREDSAQRRGDSGRKLFFIIMQLAMFWQPSQGSPPTIMGRIS